MEKFFFFWEGKPFLRTKGTIVENNEEENHYC